PGGPPSGLLSGEADPQAASVSRRAARQAATRRGIAAVYETVMVSTASTVALGWSGMPAGTWATRRSTVPGATPAGMVTLSSGADPAGPAVVGSAVGAARSGAEAAPADVPLDAEA